MCMGSTFSSKVTVHNVSFLFAFQISDIRYAAILQPGCLSCISVIKECYQIGLLGSSLRSFFFSYIS